MANTVFDSARFLAITESLMARAPDRAKALMVENNAYYLLVNLHIFCCNMVEFADDGDSELEPLIEELKTQVEALQHLKASRWLDDFVEVTRSSD
ncbi:MAG: hypothetical protein EBS77_00200 [Gammaproteobacteria bacterium]|nr:hypothetical protein [Gammaproteobacteria bacterium]